MCTDLVLYLIYSMCLISVNYMWGGSLPKFDFDVRLMKPNIYWKGMKKIIAHMMRLSGESRAGSQSGPKITWERSDRRRGAGVIIPALLCVPKLAWFKILTSPKGFLISLLRFEAEGMRTWWDLKLLTVIYQEWSQIPH